MTRQPDGNEVAGIVYLGWHAIQMLFTAKRPTASLLVFAIVLGGCGNRIRLPPIEAPEEIRISSFELDEVIVRDSDEIQKIVSFVNRFEKNWGVPWYGPPVAKLSFDFYQESKFVGSFGLSTNFATRGGGGMLSRSIDAGAVRKFATSTHPAVHEALYLSVPEGREADRLLTVWKRRLDELRPGMTQMQLKAFVNSSSARVVADYPTFQNVVLQTVHDGQYVDTVVMAQFLLKPDRSLEKVRFIGYKHSKPDREANSANSFEPQWAILAACRLR